MCALHTIIHILLCISQSVVVDEGGTTSSGKKGFGIGKTGAVEGIGLSRYTLVGNSNMLLTECGPWLGI